MTAPSAWTLQQVMSIAQATLARMEADGTLDTDEAALMDALRQEVPEVDDVLVRLLRARGEALANEEAISSRVDALQAREARFAKQAEAYRGAINAVMYALGITKWRHAEFSVSLSPGRPGVVITDEAALGPMFTKTKVEPDKAKIREFLEAGTPVTGAHLANGLPTLTVRTK